LFGCLGFAVLLVAAMGYFSARAIAKESEAARLQSDFVAAVSHEFRTPLTSMRQFTSMLSEGRVSNEEERGKYYEALSRGTQRLTRLVENLLDFGRLEAGSHGYNMERVRARDWLERVISEFREEVERRGYHVELTWDAPEETLLRADDAALGRALWNLLDNAVKYSPDSKTIWVEGRAEGGWLTFSVRDRGIGIPANEHRRIFGKFVRGTIPGGRPVRGTGLGLALVEQIVRAHSGTVSVESKVGEGSTFCMRFPKQV
jgi:signal transduction histidine kinase